ncbi:transglycosylase SLT domain-containing protein [Streptomyces sp. NPDC002888]|uniref:transglycosylase SLT domain-containing protein n=1 Tax=Streptomyces sp. NPDC002888 TaxID=3364668 RepID=UPI003688FEE8
MAGDLDIVGTAAVDIVPIAPTFHAKLQAIALPAADRVGEEAGRRFGEAMSRHIVPVIPRAITTGGNAARTASTRAGDDNAGAFGRAFKSRLEVAFRSLPRPDVRLSTTGFDSDLARVRARMQTLSGKRIGVDIDAETAFAELEAIDAKLAELGSRSPNIQVRSDIATARAELAEMQRLINDVDRDDVKVKVRADTGQANAALMQLAVSLGAVAALPVIPIAAAGIGAIASAAVAAGAGVGALALAAIPAIKGVTSAIQAKSAAEKESANATDNSAAANKRASQSALQMASAQASLRSAHRQAAQQIEQANRQVENAERALGQAAARAMEQRRQAAESVERAERSLSDAKRQARDAEESLTQARRDATQQLADLNDKLTQGKLDEREATLRVQEAEQELNRVREANAAGTATDLQLERAQLAYDQATEAAKQQKKDYSQLQKDADAATKAGVDGNADVKRATEQLSDAQRNVQDQTEALADAHREAAKAQVDAAQTVADAQRAVSDAVQNAADTQVQAAEQIASAERGVEAARLSSVNTTAQAVSKSDEYRKALDKLTPSQRALYDSIAGPKGLKSAFDAWQTSVQPDVLPLFTRAVDGVKNALPGLTPLVKNAADGVSELQDAASEELKSPFWQQFKRGIQESAEPAIVGFGKSFGNILKGSAGVISAFLSHIDSIAQHMIDATGTFADWGSNLKGSPAFEGFLDYVKERGPLVAETLGKIGGAFLDVATALEPFAGVILELLGNAAEIIGWVAENAPWAIQLLYGLWIATRLVNLAMASNPIGLVVLALVALAVALKYAWDHSETFRDIVKGTWDVVSTSVSWAWTTIIQPMLIALWEGLKWVGDKFSWLYVHAVKPSFDWISEKATWLWENALGPALINVWDGLKWVGDKFKWLYDHGVKEPFEDISDMATWLYDVALKPAFDNIRTAVGLVGDAFEDARKAIKVAWDQVAGIAARPVNFLIEWAYTKGIKALWDHVADFVGLDPLPNAPKLLEAPEKFANGGRTHGGIPGKDSIPILAMADEFIIRRDSARKIGFDNLAYMNATGELPRFKDGGIVGALSDAWDWTKDTIGGAVSQGVDWAKTGADLLAHPSKVWARLMKPILDSVRERLNVGGLGATLAKFPAKMASGLLDKIVGAVTPSGGGGSNIGSGNGGSGVARWRPTVLQALSMTGNPASYADLTLRRMNQESGGNPTIVNKWDSNWTAGHPSVGLMQVIGPTFRAYAGKMRNVGPFSYGVSTNPLANIYASMRYAMSAYGSLPTAYNRPGGYAKGGRVVPNLYDDGGYLPPGLSLVANGTGSPEPVMTSQQFADMRAAKSGGTPNITVHSHTYLGTHEITDIVDRRVEIFADESATALSNGRRI